jgi:hypothetical protein
MSASDILDATQTALLATIAVGMIYVLVFFGRGIKEAARNLGTTLKRQRDIEVRLERILRRIETIEKRQGLQGEELSRIKLRLDAVNVEQHQADPPSS